MFDPENVHKNMELYETWDNEKVSNNTRQGYRRGHRTVPPKESHAWGEK